MARRRKKGDTRKRTKSGQLSRAGQRVSPSERTQAMLDKYGNHYSSALGRAYAKGLLGQGNEAKTRLDAGNKFSLRYSKIIGGDCYSSPLDDSVRGGGASDPSRDLHQQEWLFEVMDRLDKSHRRGALDHMVSKEYTDAGPWWLDMLVEGSADPACLQLLKRGIEALDIVAATHVKETTGPIDFSLIMCDCAVNA